MKKAQRKQVAGIVILVLSVPAIGLIVKTVGAVFRALSTSDEAYTSLTTEDFTADVLQTLGVMAAFSLAICSIFLAVWMLRVRDHLKSDDMNKPLQ